MWRRVELELTHNHLVEPRLDNFGQFELLTVELSILDCTITRRIFVFFFFLNWFLHYKDKSVDGFVLSDNF